MTSKIYLHILIALIAFVGLPTGAVIANDAEPPAGYHLGPQDKIAIRVYEWRPSLDQIYEWTALKAQHMIDGSGAISLPLAGEIKAQGLTTSELAQDIGDRLKARMGLAGRPDVSIEIVQLRPFYVVGAVAKPGEYAYRPGLSVLEAYAIAGGRPQLGALRLEREAISARGDVVSYELEAQMLMLLIARLKAELSGDSSIEWPAELASRLTAGPLGRVAEQEKMLFRTRQESFHTQLTALEQLQRFLEGEVTSLEKQLHVQEIEVASLREEWGMVSELYKKGLTVNSRRMALERNVAQVDGDRLRLEANLMRARQEGTKTKISIIDLRAKRNSEISAETQSAQNRLEAVRAKAHTARDLLLDTQSAAPQLYGDSDDAQQMKPSFKIIRDGQELEVSEATPVLPGDTLVIAPALLATAPDVAASKGDALSPLAPRLSDLME